MSNVKIYNTLTATKETLKPRDQGKVSIYACGLTAQGPAHIGHLRGALVLDMARRWLSAVGYEVRIVQNFTDVDDKIIAKANEQGMDPGELARRYSGEYLHDLESLDLDPSNIVWCRVTEHMPEILEVVQALVDSGHAYPVDGDVYFRASTFKEYGKLSKQDLDQIRSGARIEVDERKENPMDWALWKAAKPGEPHWTSPWGEGRPGWHIECSALALHYLGAGFDIHAGGSDLIFPHHENEIAQSEAFTKSQFANIWMHWGFVQLGEEKMSKSVGNVVGLHELLKTNTASGIRMYMLQTHYRSAVQFDSAKIAEAEKGLTRAANSVDRARKWIADAATGRDGDAAGAGHVPSAFADAMNDDFNTPQAIGQFFDTVTQLNQLTTDSNGDKANVALAADKLKEIEAMAEVLGLSLETQEEGLTDSLAESLMDLAIQWRNLARQEKQFKIADAMRDDLAALGISLEDSPSGTSWRKN